MCRLPSLGQLALTASRQATHSGTGAPQKAVQHLRPEIRRHWNRERCGVSLGQRLRRYLDLSQAELASTARCSVNTVRKLEAEERRRKRLVAVGWPAFAARQLAPVGGGMPRSGERSSLSENSST